MTTAKKKTATKKVAKSSKVVPHEGFDMNNYSHPRDRELYQAIIDGETMEQLTERGFGDTQVKEAVKLITGDVGCPIC